MTKFRGPGRAELKNRQAEVKEPPSELQSRGPGVLEPVS